MTRNALALALEHRVAADEARDAVARERELRAELLKKLFPEGAPGGTTTLDLGRGHKLKVEVRTAASFDQATAAAALETMRGSGDLGAELAERLFRRKLELAIGEFKKLPKPFAKQFAKIVTLGQAAPSVELQGPD